MDSLAETMREPVVTFALLLAVLLIVPPIFERLRLPGLVGLLGAGVLLGSSGFNLLDKSSETMTLLSDIGKIYLMFVAGLEIDLEQFRQKRDRAIGFGSATFAIPLIFGIIVGHLFGFSWNASILIGSLLASHTLLAYPIVRRLGVVNDESVIVTIGATIFTDIGALLVLAICIGVSQGEFSLVNLVTLVGGLVIYSVAVLYGIDSFGKAFFRRSPDDQGNQFLFVLLAVFLASVGAQLIGVEKIVGAFLAGLAVNDVVGDGPVKEKIEFVGSVILIPIFFISMGLLLDLDAFAEIFTAIALPLTILVALLLSKFLAAYTAKLLYSYTWNQTLTMWSLSVPQVAATLAAALVGFEAKIIDRNVFNSVILLMLVTSVVGPLITSRTAARLAPQAEELPATPEKIPVLGASLVRDKFTVVVPVYNPSTEQYLIELAALFARHQQGEIVPLAIARAQSHLDSPQLEKAIARSQVLLDRAKDLARELGVEARPQLRIDYDIAGGIGHVSREVNASLIILGQKEPVGFRARVFGNITDRLLWSAHCSVAIARLKNSPLKVQQILVPMENFTAAALRPLHVANLIAQENQARITLLHICPSYTSQARQTWLQEQLAIVAKTLSVPVNSLVLATDNIADGIAQTAYDCDLVVLRSRRQRIGADGLALSELTTPLFERLAGSVLFLGEL